MGLKDTLCSQCEGMRWTLVEPHNMGIGSSGSCRTLHMCPKIPLDLSLGEQRGACSGSTGPASCRTGPPISIERAVA